MMNGERQTPGEWKEPAWLARPAAFSRWTVLLLLAVLLVAGALGFEVVRRGGWRPEKPPRNQSIILPQPFDLAAAIADAASGATVKIPPGVYSSGLALTKSIRLVGTPGEVIIQSSGRASLSVLTTGVSVQGLQFVVDGVGDVPAVSIAEDAALELENCRVQSNTAVGLTMTTDAQLHATSTYFSAANGVALRVLGGKVVLREATFAEARTGLSAAGGAQVELQSCAFERSGTGDLQGGIVIATGDGTEVRATDGRFTGNTGGIVVTEGASLVITGSNFRENGASAKVAYGVVAISRGARAQIKNSTFEANSQGVAVSERGTVEIDGCTFTGNGAQTRPLVLATMPISITGEGSSASIRDTTIADSAQIAIVLLDRASATLEKVEISGAKSIGLSAGDPNNAPTRVEIAHSKFHHNPTGLGLYAGSTAKIEETEFSENGDGLMIGDRNTFLELHHSLVTMNSDRGLLVYNDGGAVVKDSRFMGNERGAQSGLPQKSSEKSSLTLEDCEVGGNRVFGVGCFANNELILRQVNFIGGDKEAIFKERGALVQIENRPDDATAGTSASPSPAVEKERGKSAKRKHARKPGEDTRPFFRRIFRRR